MDGWMALMEAVGGCDTHLSTNTLSTGSGGDDSILSATDLETAAYVSIPRTVVQARRKLNLDGLCSPTYGSPSSVQFKSIVTEKHSPDDSNVEMSGFEGEFKTPQSKGRSRRGSSNISIGSSPSLFSPSPRTGDTSPSASRFDSSLYMLTSKFMDLMHSSEQGSVNLNEAAAVLGVPKRRIYDITNVLEGVGMVEKSGKNCCTWTAEHSSMMQEDKNSIRERMNRLKKEENHLDDLIAALQNHLSATMGDPENASLGYIRYDDLRNTNEFTDKTIIAIKAPADTVLEVPNPGETGTYQMTIRSQTGQPVEVYLCPDRPAASKPPSIGYYASQEFSTQADTKQVQTTASQPEMQMECCSNNEDANQLNKGSNPMERNNRGCLFLNEFISSSSSTTKLSSNVDNVLLNNVIHTQSSPRLGPQLFSPRSDVSLPFLSLDPPPEPDDYLFALEPYEGAADLFDIYVSGNGDASVFK